jgi:hypothetical protein
VSDDAGARLIRECVSEDSSAAALHAAVGAVRDWSAVAELADRHGVAAYVSRIVGGSISPAEAAPLLRERELAAMAHVLVLDAALERVIPGFAASGIDVIALKGPALARWLYPAASLRAYTDLDLLVRPGDEDRAAEVLWSLQLYELPYLAELSRSAHPRHASTAPFHRTFAGANGVMVELHVDPLQLGLPSRDDDARWRRAVPIPGVADALMLGREDQLIHLALHAHKHGFSRLIWLKDIDLLIRREGPRLDWDLASEGARREGVGASVWYALRLAHAVLATPEPAALASFRPGPLVRRLFAALWPPKDVAALQGRMRRRAVQLHVADAWRGVIPSLVMMGRRRDRLAVITRSISRSRRP